MITTDGEMESFTKLENLLRRKNSYNEKERKSKLDDMESLKKFIKVCTCLPLHNQFCRSQVAFFPIIKVIPQFFIRGISSNTPLIKRIDKLLQGLGFASCLQACKANGHALLAKSGEKRGGRGSCKFLQLFTLPQRPK